VGKTRHARFPQHPLLCGQGLLRPGPHTPRQGGATQGRGVAKRWNNLKNKKKTPKHRKKNKKTKKKKNKKKKTQGRSAATGTFGILPLGMPAVSDGVAGMTFSVGGWGPFLGPPGGMGGPTPISRGGGAWPRGAEEGQCQNKFPSVFFQNRAAVLAGGAGQAVSQPGASRAPPRGVFSFPGQLGENPFFPRGVSRKAGWG